MFKGKPDSYYENLDKRTKEYKEWIVYKNSDLDEKDVLKNQSEGLGDDIAEFTRKTGIEKVVKKVVGNDCGCTERRRKLNKERPKARTVLRCPTDEQIIQYKEYQEKRTLNIWQDDEIKLLCDLYAHVYAVQYHPHNLCKNCGGAANILLRITTDLDQVFETYKTKTK